MSEDWPKGWYRDDPSLQARPGFTPRPADEGSPYEPTQAVPEPRNTRGENRPACAPATVGMSSRPRRLGTFAGLTPCQAVFARFAAYGSAARSRRSHGRS